MIFLRLAFDHAQEEGHTFVRKENETCRAPLKGRNPNAKNLVANILDTKVCEFPDAAPGVETSENQVPESWRAAFEQGAAFFTVQKEQPRGMHHGDAL